MSDVDSASMGSQKNKKSRGARRADKTRKRADRHATVTPIHSRGAATVDSTLSAFDRWLDDTNFESDPLRRENLVISVRILIDGLIEANPRFQLDDWSMPDVDLAYNFAEFVESDGGPRAVTLVFAGRMLVDFLISSSRWSGSPDTADDVIDALDGYVADHFVLPGVVIPDVDPSLELVVLDTTRVIRNLTALLEWIGDEKPTTPSRWLKPSLLPDLLPDLDMLAPVGELSSMSHFGQLVDLWDLAQSLGLIDVNTVRVRPGVAAEQWFGQDSLSFRRNALSMSVRTTLLHDEPYANAVADVIVARVVYQGMTAMPFPANAFDIGTDDPDGQVVNSWVRVGLRLILDDGWLEVDENDHYVVREELRPAVWQGFPDELNPELDSELDPELDIESVMLTVRIQMVDVQPTVWRRLRIDSVIVLSDFHRILQTVLGWKDYHLYQFISTEGGESRRFMSEAAIDDDLQIDPDTESADTVSVGDVLGKAGDELLYEYDFGDGWEVRIVVEGVEPVDDDNEPMISVVEGSGTAPFEDVGGPYGWTEFIEAINDPAHERHDELRRWARLPPKLTFDPTVFDAIAANRLLTS